MPEGTNGTTPEAESAAAPLSEGSRIQVVRASGILLVAGVVLAASVSLPHLPPPFGRFDEEKRSVLRKSFEDLGKPLSTFSRIVTTPVFPWALPILTALCLVKEWCSRKPHLLLYLNLSHLALAVAVFIISHQGLVQPMLDLQAALSSGPGGHR